MLENSGISRRAAATFIILLILCSLAVYLLVERKYQFEYIKMERIILNQSNRLCQRADAQFRPLQVDLGRGGGKVGEGHALGQAFAQGREVPGGAGRVDHDHKGVRAEAVDNAVVQHAAFGVEQEAVAALARCEGSQIMAHRAGQGRIRARAFNAEFAHMTDVEKTGMLTGVLMLDQNALILDGHEPTGEGSHFGPVRLMPGGERRTQFRHGFSFAADLQTRPKRPQPVAAACDGRVYVSMSGGGAQEAESADPELPS